MSEDDDGDIDDRLLDSTEQLKIHDESSSGASRSYLGLEGEGSYSDEGVDGQEGVLFQGTGKCQDLQQPAENEVFQQDSFQQSQQQAEPGVLNFSALRQPAQCFGVPSFQQLADGNEDSAVRMQSVIQPPGTNPDMQKVMRSRLASDKTTSSVSSEKDVQQDKLPMLPPGNDEKMAMVMESRLQAALKASTSAVRSDVGSGKVQQATQVNLARRQFIGSSRYVAPANTNVTQGREMGTPKSLQPTVQLERSAGVLKAKDTNVKSPPPAMLKLASKSTSEEQEDDELQEIWDIERDPFFSGGCSEFQLEI